MVSFLSSYRVVITGDRHLWTVSFEWSSRIDNTMPEKIKLTYSITIYTSPSIPRIQLPPYFQLCLKNDSEMLVIVSPF